jgi:alkanesulfonate monooxygenase SsuD/methylene tetrahydromethanopterin reductase-like flavin-dependent oxidoreductase (luciferase family)
VTELHLAVALDGAGWHPAAWRLPTARPAEIMTAGYWADLVGEAERGLLDFVTIEDALSIQSSTRSGPDGRTDQVRGRLDAVLVAARVAPTTTHIGLVPTATVTHTEPFHVSKSIATLDHVSSGRAGWRVQLSARADEAGHVGRRAAPDLDRDVDDLFDEAGDFVDVVRRLWDSWEDDAEIRDVATGRFIDRDKLHHIDFEGRWFSVRGPSITPRPPQGQPLVAALAHVDAAYAFAARHADLVFVTPDSDDQAAAIVAQLPEVPHVLGDLVVLLEGDERAAHARKAHLDELAGAELVSDAEIFVGTPSGLADLLTTRRAAGLSGFRLRPAALPDDLLAITGQLVPELQRRGLFRTSYDHASLRGRLGLARPANRYATA